MTEPQRQAIVALLKHALDVFDNPEAPADVLVPVDRADVLGLLRALPGQAFDHVLDWCATLDTAHTYGGFDPSSRVALKALAEAAQRVLARQT